MNHNADGFWDFYVQDGEKPVFCYRSGLTVYEEALIGGVLVSQGWNAAGYPLNVLTNCPTRLDPKRFAEPFAFELDIDGGSVNHDLRLVEYTCEPVVNGIHCRVVLDCETAPIRVVVNTRLDGTAMMERWLELENTSDHPLRVGNLSLISGGAECMDVSLLSGVPTEKTVYSLGYFDGDEWGEEGLFSWHPLRTDGTFVDCRFGRDRYRHPMMFIRNHLNGTIRFVQIAYAGGCRFSVDYDRSLDGLSSSLSFKAELTGHRPLLILRPFETFRVPSVHIGLVHGDTDDAVAQMHDHARRSVFSEQPSLLVGAGMGAEHDMSVETSKAFIDQFADMGAEVFIVDAGWQNPPHKESDWESYNGLNRPDPLRYPNGIGEVADYCREKGMKFSLWVEIERLGRYSEMYAAHPEWRLSNLFGEQAKGFLDFTNPQVLAWAESELARILEEMAPDMLRVDHNSHCVYYHTLKSTEVGMEYTALRHFEAVNGMYARLKARFPHVIFENCAGGGGRTDYGFMKSFHHTWVSDWQKLPRSALITSGMTMALPPERVDRLFAGMGCHTAGDLMTQLRNAMFGHMSLNVISPAGSLVNPVATECIGRHIRLYKERIRPMLPTCRVFHPTADVWEALKEGVLCLEIAADDASCGLIGAFSLSDRARSQNVAVSGAERSGRYRVRFMNEDVMTVLSGQELRTNGIFAELGSALSSEMIYYERIDE